MTDFFFSSICVSYFLGELHFKMKPQDNLFGCTCAGTGFEHECHFSVILILTLKNPDSFILKNLMI